MGKKLLINKLYFNIQTKNIRFELEFSLELNELEKKKLIFNSVSMKKEEKKIFITGKKV